jgi:hypothetical protein
MPIVPDPGAEEHTPEGRKCELCGEPFEHISIDAGFPVVIDPKASFVQKALDDHQLSSLKKFDRPIGFDLRLMFWGDGSGVPTSGRNLAIVGTDDKGRLHIRIFDGRGQRVTDTDETKLPPSQAQAILTLKQQLPGLLPPHVLTDSEKARVIGEATSIAGLTRPIFIDPDGYDLRLMPWGDGTGVPTSGNDLVILGTDDEDRLHIRIFDQSGNRVTDTDETKLPPAQAQAIVNLKERLPGLLPPRELTYAERAQLHREARSIVGLTHPDDLDLSGLVDDPALRRLEVAYCPRCLEAMGPGEMIELFCRLGLRFHEQQLDTELTPAEIDRRLTHAFGNVVDGEGRTRSKWREASRLACELYGHNEFSADTWRHLRERLLDYKDRDFNKLFSLDVTDIIFVLQQDLVEREERDHQNSGDSEEVWVPANQAVEDAKRLGFKISPSTASKRASRRMFASRPAPEGEMHKREFGLGSFLRHIFRTMKRSPRQS